MEITHATGLDIFADGAIEGDFAFYADVAFEAAADPSGQAPADPNRSRPVDMLAYTGGVLNLPNYDHPVVADLSGMTWPNERLPLRVRHGKEVFSTIGQTDRVTSDQRQLRIHGIVIPLTPEAKHVIGLQDGGFKWQASIEAKLRAKTQFVPAGQTVQLNGQTFTGPLYVAPKTLLTGIGFVENGADSKSSAVIAASVADPSAVPSPQGGSVMNFESWCAANGIDPSALDPGQLTLAKAMYAGAQAEGAEPMQASAIQAALTAVRASAAPAAAPAAPVNAGAGSPDPTRPMNCSLDVYASLCTGHPDIEAQAIEGNWSQDQTRRAVRVHTLRTGRPQGRLPSTSFSNAERALDAHVIQASMLLASGMGEEQVGHSFETLDRHIPQAERERIINCALAPANRLRSFSGVFRRLLSARGLPTPDDKSELLNEAIYASQQGLLDIEAAVGNTMVNLPGIFGDYMNKNLLAAYEQLPSVIPEFCQEIDVADFHTMHNFRFEGMGGEMYELGTTGELKTVSFKETDITNRLKTRGFMLTLPREMMINDDLGVTSQITNLIGLNARRTRERIGFRTLLRAFTTLFTTGHANYLTGASSVLAANGDAVRLALTKFAKQKDGNGDPLMIQADRIITGTTLGPLAGDLYSRDGLMIAKAGATDATTTAFSDNRVKNKLRPIVSPFMDPGNTIYDTDGTTDLGSDTKWIAACDPKLLALVQFVYLSGKRSPTVETRADASFNTLGMSWRCFWDINASAMEYRAGVGSDGA